jgi:hypothetical protein
MNMNLKVIGAYTRKALLIALAILVIAGATGLSYTAHYCHGSLSGVAFYTELGIQQKASCGCKEDANTGKVPSANDATSINSKGCCSNLSFFNKLNIESISYDFSALTLIQPAVIAVFSSNTFLAEPENINISDSDFVFRPPPLAGRQLVLFLSQQRIPLISYNC